MEVDRHEIDLKVKSTIIVKTNKHEVCDTKKGAHNLNGNILNKRQSKEASKAQTFKSGAQTSSNYSLRVRRPDSKPTVVIHQKYNAPPAADYDQNKENKVVRVTLQKTEAEPQATGSRSRSSRNHKALRSKSNNSGVVEKTTVTANVTSHE